MINHSEKDLQGYKLGEDRECRQLLMRPMTALKTLKELQNAKIDKIDQGADSYQTAFEKLIASSTMFSDPLGRK